MKVGITNSLSSFPIIFAIQNEIFRDYNLDINLSLYSSWSEIEEHLSLGYLDYGEVNLVSFLKHSLQTEANPDFYPFAPLSFTQCKFYSDNSLFTSTNFQINKNLDYYTILPSLDSIQYYIFTKVAKQLFTEKLPISKNILSLNLAEKFFYSRECLGIVGDPLVYPFLYEVRNIFQIFEDRWIPSTVLCFRTEILNSNSSNSLNLFLDALHDSVSLMKSSSWEDIFEDALNFFKRNPTHLSINDLKSGTTYIKKFAENVFPISFENKADEIFTELISSNFDVLRSKQTLAQIRDNIQAIKSDQPIKFELESTESNKINKIRYQKVDAEMYRVLFRECVSMMMLVNDELIILDVNNKFLQITGLNLNEVIGKSLHKFFPKGNDFELIQNNLNENHLSTQISRLTLNCQNGNFINVDVHIAPFKKQAPKDFLITLLDTTEKKEVLRLKNEFISNISHELRTPMTNIQGYFEMLLFDPEIKLSNETRNTLGAIDRNIKKMIKLIDNLLQLGKEKYENQPQLTEIFEAHTVIEEVLYLNDGLAKEKELEIRKNLEPEVFIQGNKFEFSQAITNLIVNAIKYTKEGYIYVSCKINEENLCEIKIKDTGIGISSKYHSAIFQRFFRVPENPSLKEGGTGIGLAITKEIIEKMNGKIKLESELGKGSEFTILLPLAN